MKSRIMLILVGAVSLTMASGLRAGVPESEKGSVVGTWFTQVTLRNCQTGAEIRSFPALNTFNPGGTLIDTTTAVSPALRSPGHGAWEKTGDNTYSSVSWAFLFNPAGVWTASQKITQAIKIENGQYASTASSQVFDTSGNLLSAGCSTAVATRVEVAEE